MPFNYQKLRQRVLTAILYAPAVIAAVYFGELPFFIMILLLGFLSVQEMYTMYSLQHKLGEHYYIGYLFTALLLTAAYMRELDFFWQHNIIFVLTLGAVIYFIFELWCKKIFVIKDSTFFIYRTIFYIGLLYSYAILLRNLPNGLNYLIYVVAVVWINDIFAYLIGLPLGRHKLSPEVSPKKSIEGALGAMLGAVLMSVNLKFLLHVSLTKAIIIGIILSIFAQVGDLIESLLKRELKAKDSGDVLPGHGGILDRMDSFTLTIPVFYLFINYIIN